jgi:hypothetical protein
MPLCVASPWTLQAEKHAAGRVRLGVQFFPAGVLTVGVIEARKLPDRDSVGRQDPYVVLTLDGECRSFRQQTKVDTDGGRDPVWNQVFQFDVVDHFILKVRGPSGSWGGVGVGWGGGS